MQPGFYNYLQQNAPRYAAFTGDDARIDPTKAGYDTNVASYANTPGNRQTVQNEVNKLYEQYNSQNQARFQAPNILGGGSYATPPPNWNLTSIYNQAGSQAAGQVNPYYTKQLQDFQTNQASAKALQQQQQALNLQNLQQTQDTNLGQNELQRGRTSADVLQNEQQIGIKADQAQQDQGQAFDQQRIAEAKAQANAGLTGSGLGAQQTLASQTAHNVQEQRQGEVNTQQVAAQELTKARTFEDLANSDVLAKSANTQGQKQQSIDWDKFVQGQTQDLQSTQNTLEQQRLARLSDVQRQLAKQQVNDMISKLSNPQQRLAAASAYGSAF